jgi:hypothetical protein
MSIWMSLGLLGCLVACGHREPSRSDEASEATGAAATLAVVTPAAGDVWKEGETYTIRWRAPGVDRVNLGVAVGGKDKGHVAFNLPASRDSLRWRVPEGFVSGFGIDRSAEVRIRIEDARDPARYADSPRFVIMLSK